MTGQEKLSVKENDDSKRSDDGSKNRGNRKKIRMKGW